MCAPPQLPQTVPRGFCWCASMQPPRPPQKCNASRARCPTSSLRVSMQLTLSPAASHMGHTQLSLPQAWPTSPRGPSQGHQRPRAPRHGGREKPGRGPGRRTHRRGGGARRGCPCPRRRGWVRRRRQRGLCGAPGCGPSRRGERRPISARLPPGPARGPAGFAASRGREPPRAARAGFRARCLTRLPWQPELEAFPAPAPGPAAPPLLPPRSHTQNSLSGCCFTPARSPATPSRRAGISLIGK